MPKNKPLVFILFILSILVASLACAVDTVPAHVSQDAVNPLVAFLQQSIFPLITAFFMGIVTLFLNRLGKKYGIEALTQQNNLLEKVAFQGITKAEELAAIYVGSKAALTGQDKLSIAVKHILSVMPKVSQAQAESITHAILAQIPGVGASGDTAIERYPMMVPAVPEEAAPIAEPFAGA